MPVAPLWSDEKVIVFRQDSIEPGTLACLTQLPLAIDGMLVQPEGAGDKGPKSKDKGPRPDGQPKSAPAP